MTKMIFDAAVQTLLLIDTYMQIQTTPNAPVTEKPLYPNINVPPDSKCLFQKREMSIPDNNLTSTQIGDYQIKVMETLRDVEKLWKEAGKWNVTQNVTCGGKIHKTSVNYQKIYAVIVDFPVLPCRLADLLFSDLGKEKGWKKEIVKKVDVLLQIDEQMSITHSLTTSYPLLSTRDFMDLNYVGHHGSSYYHIFSSVNYSIPADPTIVRAINYPGGLLLQPVETPQGLHTRLIWIINTDYKLNIFIQLMAERKLVQTIASTVCQLKDYIKMNEDILTKR